VFAVFCACMIPLVLAIGKQKPGHAEGH